MSSSESTESGNAEAEVPPKEEKVTQWTNLGNLLDFISISEAIQINNDEFVIATGMMPKNYVFLDKKSDSYKQELEKLYKSKKCGVWSYNVVNKKWSYIIHYNTQIISIVDRKPEIVYNQNKSELIVYSEYPYCLFGININNHNHIIYDKYGGALHPDSDSDPKMQFVNDSLHVISNFKSSDSNINQHCQHVSYDFNTKKKIVIHEFTDQYSNIMGFSFIYLKKKKKLIIIGGYDLRKDMYIFDIKLNKWNKINDILPKYTLVTSFSCMVTQDDKYIIIMNSLDTDGDYEPIIYVINIDNKQCKFSKIKSPISYQKHNESTRSILIDESMSTNGLNYSNNMDLFINQYCKQLGMDYNIPYDIISTIKKMYTKEVIHLLEQDFFDVSNTNHWCINFDHILGVMFNAM